MTKEEKKDIKGKFLRYALPSVAAMWVYTIYTMVDGMFVARGVGTTALAAVNISMPFINTAFALGILLAVGASTRASVYKGQGQYDEANRVFTTSVITVFCMSIIVVTIAMFNLDKVATLLGADEETHQYVVDYLGIIIPFVICYMTSYNLEVLIKADGHPKKAIATTLCGAATNIILDYVFIFIFHWGIKGAAFATGLSQLMTLSIFFGHFVSKKSGFSFVKIKWKLSTVLRMAKIGIADAVTEFSVGAIIFMFNNVLINISGNDGVVIYTVIAYVYQLILMTMMGINQGMQPLVSFYFGRNEPHVHRYILRVALISSGIASVLAFAAGVIYPDPVVGVFIDKALNAELFLEGVSAFRIYALSFLPLGTVIILGGYFTALEKPKFAMSISIGRGLVFVTIALFAMAYIFGETGIWLAMSVSEFTTFAMAVVMFIYTFVKKTDNARADIENNN